MINRYLNSDPPSIHQYLSTVIPLNLGGQSNKERKLLKCSTYHIFLVCHFHKFVESVLFELPIKQLNVLSYYVNDVLRKDQGYASEKKHNTFLETSSSLLLNSTAYPASLSS